ncbi:serine hydrolase domain-containing protein [Proteiniclasticum sp. C24MP]|uniref:serine hydrolase domain-containing protein n=1 Tax=Proteiniclasticum sp. C24MP TaxID=3374101 RepID=UPI003755273A
MEIEKRRKTLLNELPGFSGVLSLTRKNEVLYEEAFGLAVVNEAVPNTVGTRFPVASGSKIFTAVAALKLVEKGALSLTDSVTTLLPDSFPFMDRSVTVGHLLTHTSGFQDYFREDADENYADLWKNLPMYAMRTPKDFLVLLKDNRMEFQSGEKFSYNDGGFVILSMLIESVTGQPFPEVVKETVFLPAAMEESGYFAMNALPPNTALGYYEEEPGQLVSNIYAIPVIGGGDGGAYTTVSDMRRFWKALQSEKLLQDPLLLEMCSVQAENEKERYGYGVWIRKDASPVSGLYVMGADPGISMISEYDLKTELTLTILCNREDQAFKAYGIMNNFR